MADWDGPGRDPLDQRGRAVPGQLAAGRRPSESDRLRRRPARQTPAGTYLGCMDGRTHEDVAAAAAVHRELGHEYDSALAEGLIERISSEIDKQVDARLA